MPDYSSKNVLYPQIPDGNSNFYLPQGQGNRTNVTQPPYPTGEDLTYLDQRMAQIHRGADDQPLNVRLKVTSRES